VHEVLRELAELDACVTTAATALRLGKKS
jgi:hypothetical protein